MGNIIEVNKTKKTPAELMTMPINHLERLYLDKMDEQNRVTDDIYARMNKEVDSFLEKIKEKYSDELDASDEIANEAILYEKILEARVLAGEKSRIIDVDMIHDCYCSRADDEEDYDDDYYDDEFEPNEAGFYCQQCGSFLPDSKINKNNQIICPGCHAVYTVD